MLPLIDRGAHELGQPEPIRAEPALGWTWISNLHSFAIWVGLCLSGKKLQRLPDPAETSWAVVWFKGNLGLDMPQPDRTQPWTPMLTEMQLGLALHCHWIEESLNKSRISIPGKEDENLVGVGPTKCSR